MLKNYFRIAFRNLSKNRAYGFLNIMGLALSICCCLLIFTLVKYHLGFDNFHRDANRIYRFVTEQHRDQITYVPSVPPAFGNAFRNDYPYGEKVARIVTFDNQLISIQQATGIKKIREPEGVAFAEADYFDIFNFPLLEGSKATALAEPNTAIITEKLARKYFGNESPINKTFRLENKIDCRVTGVLKNLPPNTDQHTEIFLSWPTLKTYNDWFASDDAWGGISSSLQCFVKLRPNVSVAQVESPLFAYVKKFRPTNKNVHHYKLQPLPEIHFDGRYGGAMEKRNLWILSFIAVFLVITACVNFVNLATAQALKRSKEIGIRKALGSFRQQLFWQFLTETGVITLVAIVVAVGLSFLLLPYVNNLFNTSMSINFFSDWQLLVFIPLLLLLITFLAGAYPGIILSGFRPVMALKGKLPARSIGGFNIRRSLIVTQFTISLVLIIGMIVITRQIRYARQSDLGFNKDAVVMIPTGADSAGTAVNTLKQQLAGIRGVASVSLCYAAPSSQENWNNAIRYDSRTDEEVFKVSIKPADDQYLPTFGLKLVAGRNIFPSDSVREFLVNETMIRKLQLASPEEAVGKKIAFQGGGRSAVIVGVLKDFHDRSFHEDINAVAITSYTDLYNNYAVKINLKDITTVIPALEKTWTAMNPDKLYEYQFLDDHIAGFYRDEETIFKLIRAFTLIALFIGCLGLYGLVSFMVSQKTKEIGIRKVLGSGVAEIIWIFGKEFSRLILTAFIVAAPVAWWLMNTWLQDFKFHIQIGPSIFILAIGITLAVAAVTVGYQSVKAALMNPVKSLRAE